MDSTQDNRPQRPSTGPKRRFNTNDSGRPQRSSDRPYRSNNDRPYRSNDDRPQRSSSDNDRNSSDRPQRNYDQESRPQRSFDRPSYDRPRTSQGSGGYRGNNSNGGSGRSGGGFGNRGNRFARKTNHIDHAKYVSAAQEHTEEEVYVSTHKFADFNIDPVLKDNIIAKGFLIPTPIQDQAIPHILEGRDVIGLANTGTGKTGAFVIPLINKVLQDRRNNVIIIVPTRELAVQINDELKHFINNTSIKTALCIGGADMRRQLTNLRNLPQFVIGTPGRLKDLQNRRALNLAYFSTIVLDEVDRMLDMGFIDDIKYLISKMAPERHSLFFSATMNKSVENIAQSFLKDPITVQIHSAQRTAANVKQDIIRYSGKLDKETKLLEILRKEEFKKVLIFTRTKRGADQLQELLFDNNFKVQSIHGDKSQAKREKSLRAFREDKADILVATDVAARGLDISDISHVINYDEPENYEDYIHRIGRTGRGNKKGHAITFVG